MGHLYIYVTRTSFYNHYLRRKYVRPLRGIDENENQSSVTLLRPLASSSLLKLIAMFSVLRRLEREINFELCASRARRDCANVRGLVAVAKSQRRRIARLHQA